MNRNIIYNSLAIIVLTIMLVRPTAFAFTEFLGVDVRSLVGSANKTMISPLPIPFRDFGGFDNFSNELLFTVAYADGSEVLFTTDTVPSTGGLHRRKVVFYVGLSRGPVLNDIYRIPMYNYLCTSVFGDDARTLTVTYKNKETNEIISEVAHICSNT